MPCTNSEVQVKKPNTEFKQTEITHNKKTLCFRIKSFKFYLDGRTH